MSEAFDIKKLLKSPLTGLYWTKTIMFGLGITVLLFVGYAVYKAYVKKPESTQTIRAEEGSNVTVIQNNERRKSLIPFVEGFVEQKAHSEFNTGIRAGLRFEW